MIFMEYSAITIHFGEIWLKGRNRHNFTSLLTKNVKNVLDSESYSLENSRDRIMLRLNRDSDIESMLYKLGHVFGISWFAPVCIAKNDIGSIMESSKEFFGKKDKIRIEAHRSTKNVPFNSTEIVTHFIKNAKKLPFSLDSKSDKILRINVTEKGTLLYPKKIRGLNGLPVGSSGTAVSLLSGGIDSPVASFYAMKRGIKPIFLHVHPFATNEEAKSSKITEIVRALSLYSGRSKIYYSPSHIFQAAALKANTRYEHILFKRFIYRLAEEAANKEGAESIITGESLGQVSSQTVSNLKSSEYGINKLIIRPLIAFDKQEIVNNAHVIGTHDLSIKPYKDVCSLNAMDPATHSDFLEIEKMYRRCKLDAAVKKTLKQTEALEIG